MKGTQLRMFHKILFILICTSVAVSQNTYYVDTTGNDSNTGLSTGSPWKTCARVNVALNSGVIVAGDSILFKRNHSWQPTTTGNGSSPNGVLYIPATRAVGAESNRITFSSYGSGSKPIISVENLSNSNVSIIIAYGNKYFTLSNIEFRGGIYFSCRTTGSVSNVLVDSIYSNGTALINKGGAFATGTGNAFNNQAMVSDGSYPSTGEDYIYGHIEQIEVRNSRFVNYERCWDMYALYRDFWFHHNVAINNVYALCNAGQGTKIKVEYNYSFNNGTNAGTNSTFLKIQPQRRYIDSVVVRGNLIVCQNGKAGSVMGSFVGGRSDSIYNNTIVANSPQSSNYAINTGWIGEANGSRLMNNSDSGSGYVKNFFYANNIIYGGMYFAEHLNFDITLYDGTNWVLNENIDTMVNNGLLFRNNVIYADGASPLGTKRTYNGAVVSWNPLLMSDEGINGAYQVTTPSTQTYTNFLTTSNFDSLMNIAYGSGNLNLDPSFVDLYGSDSSAFRLTSSSLAKKAGVVIPEYTEDISGYPVPQTDGYVSIGCFQYPNDIPPSPTVTTSAGSAIYSTYFTANGVVNPNGQSTTGWIEWGTSPTLATYNNTDSSSLGSGSSEVPLTKTISSLLSSTTYYYRAAALNAGGVIRGDIVSITTAVTPVSGKRKFIIKHHD